MELTEQERQFLQTRTRFVRTWRYVGLVLLIGLGGFAGALISLVPWLANPFAVSTLLERGSVPPSTLILSAALLPVAVLTCLLLALTIVLLTFVAFSKAMSALNVETIRALIFRHRCGVWSEQKCSEDQSRGVLGSCRRSAFNC